MKRCFPEGFRSTIPVGCIYPILILFFIFRPGLDASSILYYGSVPIDLFGLFHALETETDLTLDHEDSPETDDFPLAQAKTELRCHVSIKALMSAVPGIKNLKAEPPFTPPEQL